MNHKDEPTFNDNPTVMWVWNIPAQSLQWMQVCYFEGDKYKVEAFNVITQESILLFEHDAKDVYVSAQGDVSIHYGITENTKIIFEEGDF